MGRKNGIYRRALLRMSQLLGLFSQALVLLSRVWGFDVYNIDVYASRDVFFPSCGRFFPCFGCRNTLNSAVFVMKREKVVVFSKKVAVKFGAWR